MRIESQSIVFDSRGFDEAFAHLGFARHDRDYLSLDLGARQFDDPPEHPRVVVRAWEPSDFTPAAEVVFQAYRGSIDAKLNAQYRSREGCADLLDALTDTLWCGRFDARLARVAVERDTGQMLRRRDRVGDLGARGALRAGLGPAALPERGRRARDARVVRSPRSSGAVRASPRPRTRPSNARRSTPASALYPPPRVPAAGRRCSRSTHARRKRRLYRGVKAVPTPIRGDPHHPREPPLGRRLRASSARRIGECEAQHDLDWPS
jgi:hypothetical protein